LTSVIGNICGKRLKAVTIIFLLADVGGVNSKENILFKDTGDVH